MAIFGLGSKEEVKKDAKKKDDIKKQSSSSTSSQADEAKAMLEKMQAKKDADECPFC